MASDSSSGFSSFPTRGITHFFTATQNITERVEEVTNEQVRTSVSSKHKKGEFYVTLFCAALRAFVEYRGRVFCAKLPQKPLAMLTSVDSVLLLLSTAISSRLVSSALRCQLPFCLLWDLPSLLHFRSRVQALCMGFASKQTKGSSE